MKNERILIVEDEPVTAMDERQIVESLGYTVCDTVNSGEKAIAFIMQDTPDLVLMDINLGSGKDGIETAIEIRKQFDVPVIFVTAHGNRAILDRAKKSEPFGYVIKPFSKEEMSATIEVALHKHLLEKKLHESEERFRAIADYSYDWEMWLGCNGKPKWINPAVERMTGYTVLECMDMAEYPLQLAHIEDREILSKHLHKSQKESFANDIEFRVVCKSGKDLWSAFSYQPIYDMKQKFIGSRWSIRDISARKKNDGKRLKLLKAIEQSPATVVITDTKGVIEYVNPKFTEVTGYLPSEAIGHTSRILKSGTKTPEDYKVLWDTITSGKEWKGEFHNKRKDGTLYWEFSSISPVKAENGKIINFIAVKEDITDRKKMEEDLRTAMTTAEAANKAKSEFLAIMSHELRTPLNAINGFSEMMQLEILGPLGNPGYTGYAKDIHVAGKHLLQVINDILDISKIEADAQELEKEDINVSEMVKGSVELVKGRALRASVRLRQDIPKDFPPLFADRLRLKQILLNLLTNAIKFTPQHGHVIVRSFVDADGAIALQVEDTGVGIAAEDIPKVFKPFGQVDNVMVRNQEGTGLGIPLSKTLVELHGGSLEIESVLGKGTFVTARFPSQKMLKLQNTT